MIWCKTCRVEKDESEFSYYSHNGRPKAECKTCCAVAARRWYLAHRERAISRMTKYNKSRTPGLPDHPQKRRPRRQIIDDKVRCGCCHEFKPLSDFNKAATAVHGLSNRCRPCAALESARYYRERKKK